MILICYPPGARGDFLASILLNDFEQHYQKYALTDFRIKSYKKVHWCNDMLGIPVDEYTALIRIKLNDMSDYLTVEHLSRSKISNPASPEQTLKDLISNEADCRNLDHMFTHIVDFKSLFDATYIAKLYKDITHQELTTDLIDKIKFNIRLQKWVAATVYDIKD